MMKTFLLLVSILFVTVVLQAQVVPVRYYSVPNRYLNLMNADLKPHALAQASDFSLVQMNEVQVANLSAAVHMAGPSCGGFMDIEQEVRSFGIAPEKTFEIMLIQTTGAVIHASDIPTGIQYEKTSQKMLQTVSIDRYKKALEELTHFSDRNSSSQNGVAASEFLKQRALDLAKQNGRLDVTAESLKTGGWYTQDSVVIKIPGANSALPGVLVGGHMDTYPMGKPGADDDGSGSMAVMEIYTSILQSGVKFQRDLYFAFYAAEEVGLVGSKVMAREFNQRGLKLRGVLQFDMIGYKAKEDTAEVFFVRDHTQDAMTDYMKSLTTHFLGYKGSQLGDLECGYACSDHASWESYGYATVFPFESTFEHYNPTIHTSGDGLDLINYDHAFKYLKMGVVYMTEMGEPIEK